MENIFLSWSLPWEEWLVGFIYEPVVEVTHESENGEEPVVQYYSLVSFGFFIFRVDYIITLEE